MKKLSFLLVAFCLGVFFPANTNGWDLCETAVEALDVAGEVSFSSSFSRCTLGDIISIQITWSPAEQLTIHSNNLLSIDIKRRCLYGYVIPLASVLVQKPQTLREVM